MDKAQQLLSGTKIRYNLFTQYIVKCTLKDFILNFRHPFLVGKELYDGELLKKTGSSRNSTFRFELQDHQQPESGGSFSAVTRAIFMLRCIEDEVLLLNNFSIGRHSSNDITIVDHSISKEHALIRKVNKEYIIVDKGSTNGTEINGERLEPKQEYTLQPKDILMLGRFGFMFMRPIDLFITFRFHFGQEYSLIEDLKQIIEIISDHALRNVAIKNKITYENKEKHELLSDLRAILSPKEFLEQLF
jgi:pSer/pThr/pTyr-binding forkhead associated (FHA) protein